MATAVPGTAVAIPNQDGALYVDSSGELQLDVRIDSETVWLSQQQISDLFGVSRQNVNLHLGNIYAEEELDREATCKESLQVRTEGKRIVRRKIELYSLDAILSVGYRINSKTATAFRQWATGVLKDRLIRAHRQRQTEQARLEALGALTTHVLTPDEARALLNIIGRFSEAWLLLRQYDENQLPRPSALTTKRVKRLTEKQARAAIMALKKDLMEKGEASDLFGREPGDGLVSILGNIEQTFGGQPLYPSAEEKAAALLYFIIKNHPFTDGNKRIGSLLFVHYLNKNGLLDRSDGSQRFDNNALVSLALLVAESDPKQKDTVMRLILAMLS
jgi:prophage maintenance system killer protein